MRKVVIDTNGMLSCIGKRSPHRNVFDAFLQNHFTLCFSTEILLEYEEQFQIFWGIDVSNNLLGMFETSENVEHIIVNYNWQLITSDEDDNKFVDAFMAAGADILVSDDRSINIHLAQSIIEENEDLIKQKWNEYFKT